MRSRDLVGVPRLRSATRSPVNRGPVRLARDGVPSNRVTPTVVSPIARGLVLLHALGALILVGAATHHALVAFGYLRGSFRTRLGRIYASTTAVTYVMTMTLGAWAYPTYRVHSRPLLEASAPWAATLFEIKEDVGTLAVPLVLMTWLLSRAMDPREDDHLVPPYVVMVLLTTGAIWFELTSGLLITMMKGL